MATRQDKVEAAKELAMRALARRDMTRLEVVEHLGARGVVEDIIEVVTLELEAEGAIDDERVAAEYARRRLEERGSARSQVEAELLDRGVEASLVARALEVAAPERDDAAAALEIARERVRRSKPDLEPEMVIRRAYEFLRRRGYDEDVSLSSAERAAREYLGGERSDREG